MSICDDDGEELQIQLKVLSIQSSETRRPKQNNTLASKILNLNESSSCESEPIVRLKQAIEKFEALHNQKKSIVDSSSNSKTVVQFPSTRRPKMESQSISSESVEKVSGGPIVTENPDGSIVTTLSSSVSEVHI